MITAQGICEAERCFRKWRESTATGDSFIEAVMRAKLELELPRVTFTLVETERIVKEIQVRSHRKKRINKKWRKRYGMKTVPDLNRAVLVQKENGEKVLYAHPNLIARIHKAAAVKMEMPGTFVGLDALKGEIWNL